MIRSGRLAVLSASRRGPDQRNRRAHRRRRRRVHLERASRLLPPLYDLVRFAREALCLADPAIDRPTILRPPDGNRHQESSVSHLLAHTRHGTRWKPLPDGPEGRRFPSPRAHTPWPEMENASAEPSEETISISRALAARSTGYACTIASRLHDRITPARPHHARTTGRPIATRPSRIVQAYPPEPSATRGEGHQFVTEIKRLNWIRPASPRSRSPRDRQRHHRPRPRHRRERPRDPREGAAVRGARPQGRTSTRASARSSAAAPPAASWRCTR